MTNNTKHRNKIKNIQRMMIAWADHQVDDKKKDLPEPYGDPKGIMRNLK